MSDQSPLQPQSANLKKAIAWMGEVLQAHPQKVRHKVAEEAELRFDLTPAECAFLEKHFAHATA